MYRSAQIAIGTTVVRPTGVLMFRMTYAKPQEGKEKGDLFKPRDGLRHQWQGFDTFKQKQSNARSFLDLWKAYI